jgi:fatty-acyl-CoA synthase/long-chain acyl-CoA synthetase
MERDDGWKDDDRPWQPPVPTGQALLDAAASTPDTMALIVPPACLTYAALAQRAMTVARGLYALGVRPGSAVAILLPNSVEWIETFLGAALLGAVTVPINTRYGTDELAYLVDDADVEVVVTTTEPVGRTDLAEVLVDALQGSGEADRRMPRLVVLGAGSRPGFVDRRKFEALATTVDPAAVRGLTAALSLADTAAILYTSGTTARPKGCVLRYEALVRAGTARLVERRRAQRHFVIWTPCPLFHAGALVPLIGSLATHSTYITMRDFDPGVALALLEQEGVTNAVPLFQAFTDAMLDHPAFSRTDLHALQDIITTGTPRNVARAQQAFAPAKLVAAYGMTELCAIAATSPVDEPDDERLVWDGRPFEGIELRVVDPSTGLDLAFGDVGEIVARGYCVFDRYHKDPDATAAAFDGDGWFHTGDMGVASPDGRIAFRGRFKDMLKVGGENVSALEVETFLGSHPAVRRVEVVGAPDDRLGEVVAAFVELEPGADATADELLAWCAGRIARFKTPRHIRFVDHEEWPMSATKVDKVRLRARVRAELVGADPTPSGSPAR